MKNQIILLLLLLIHTSLIAQEEQLYLLRNLFFQAGKNPCKAEEIIKIVEKKKQTSPVILGYQGTAYTMLADCKISPFAKYASFQTGRDLIENALLMQPDNLEIRFLRFSVQTHTPAFLNYNNIEEDKKILLDLIEKDYMQFPDLVFLRKIMYTLIESGRLNQFEQQEIIKVLHLISSK